MFHKPTQKT